VAAERKTRPASLRRKLAGDLDAIVLKALEKNPSHRYGSVERLADDIQRHLAGLPVAARRDTTAYRLSKFLCRHKAAVGVLVLLFAILAATAAVAAWQVTTARAEQSRIQHELEDARREIQLLRRESGHPR
jgi:serine/threonine-protein kinase